MNFLDFIARIEEDLQNIRYKPETKAIERKVRILYWPSDPDDFLVTYKIKKMEKKAKK